MSRRRRHHSTAINTSAAPDTAAIALAVPASEFERRAATGALARSPEADGGAAGGAAGGGEAASAPASPPTPSSRAFFFVLARGFEAEPEPDGATEDARAGIATARSGNAFL